MLRTRITKPSTTLRLRLHLAEMTVMILPLQIRKEGRQWMKVLAEEEILMP